MTQPVEPYAPFTASCDAIVLAWISSPVEEQLVGDWLCQHRRRQPDIELHLVELSHGSPTPTLLDELAVLLGDHADWMVVPVRVIWQPAATPSNLRAFAALLTGRDPFRPSARRQRAIVRSDRTRARIVAAEPARVSELDPPWRERTSGRTPRDFAAFVVRRARLALERAEYRLLGPEYKSPRLVKPELLSTQRFREGLHDIPGATLEDAGRILDEMATGWSRWSVDFVPWLGRLIFRRGFERDVDYDPEQVSVMARSFETRPAVLLFSHRSNLDALVLAVAMRDNHLPRAHLFGGINMAFGVLGPVMRRAGVIFIRRNIGDNQLYKYVLKQYVGYLVEKRFNLTWSIEGSRSRTGKMLPPRLGLLSYVVDSYAASRSDDVLLQPVSISFDQLHETAEYADYARGADKKPEGMGWFVDFIRAQGERHYGKVYVRFPPAVSMRAQLGPPQELQARDPAGKRLALQKMAFEVASRIQHATPINAAALISALLIADRGTARTLHEVHTSLQVWLDYVDRRNAPMTDSARSLRTVDGVRAALDALSNGHPVSRIDGGWAPVWQVTADREHEAAFYRNTISHVFLESAIVELALVRAARATERALEVFWDQTARLRDLLKFDFYFADTAAYRENIRTELAPLGDWESRIELEQNSIHEMLRVKEPIVAPTMLRSFLEAYSIVGDVMCRSDGVPADSELVKRALGIGRQYAAQGLVRSAESVSTLLFATAAKVVADQGLLVGPDVRTRREAFRDEMNAIVGDVAALEALAADTISRDRRGSS